MEPASIRYKNPGAMWGRFGRRMSTEKEVPTNNPLAIKWGSATTFYLSDGLGQGNNIAVFPTHVQGICAQLDLWRTSAKYRNKRFADAIAIWSGGNNVPSYITFVKNHCPGITEDTIMDDTFWKGPLGIAFLKAQAWHEAGQKYPALDWDWTEAQRRVFASGSKPKAAVVVATTVTVATGAVVQQSTAAGHSTATIVMFLVAGALLLGAALWFFLRKRA